MYTYEEMIALLVGLADPDHRLIAGFTTQELLDLDYLFSRIREQIAAELTIRKD